MDQLNGIKMFRTTALNEQSPEKKDVFLVERMVLIDSKEKHCIGRVSLHVLLELLVHATDCKMFECVYVLCMQRTCRCWVYFCDFVSFVS